MADQNGVTFLARCRKIIEYCQEEVASGKMTPERAAAVAVFSLLVNIDGSGEAIGPDYRLQVWDNGHWEDMDFKHHDLWGEDVEIELRRTRSDLSI